MSRATPESMAAFQVIINGRSWVITEESGLVMRFGSGSYIAANDEWWEFDPVAGGWYPEAETNRRPVWKPRQYFQPWLKVACQIDERAGELVMKFSMLSEDDGGLQVLQRNLQDAPDTGYEREIVVRTELPPQRDVAPPKYPGESRHIYVWGMGKTAYMKIRLNSIRYDRRIWQEDPPIDLMRVHEHAPDAELIRVSSVSWVNALGGRGFELDPRLGNVLDASGGKRRLKPWDEWWNVRRPEFLKSAGLAQN